MLTRFEEKYIENFEYPKINYSDITTKISAFLQKMAPQETLRATFPTASPPAYPKLTYGLTFDQACEKHVEETFHSARPYIIASNSLSKHTSFLQRLQSTLGSRLAGTWIGIPPHTPLDAILPIMDDMRAKDADCLITLGGGSLSDGAKLISYALANDCRSVTDILKLPSTISSGHLTDDQFHEKHREIREPVIPVICIPISLSGGEYSKYAGCTEPQTLYKRQFTHPKLFPSLIILDPQITVSTPSSVWFASGVRSIDHCIEGFLSKNPKDATDAASLEALPLLVNGLLRSKANPHDLEARLQSQLGSNLSMTILFLGVMKGASHGIGHQLGPMGVGHGETSCILLPNVCKYNATVPENRTRQEKLKAMLCDQTAVQELLEKAKIDMKMADLGDVLRAIFNTLDMPRCLKDVGIGRERLEQLAENCLKEDWVTTTNPRAMSTKEQILEFLETVLE